MEKTALYDLLLTGGHVMDPASGISQVMDVATQNGKIAAMERNIAKDSAKLTLDVQGSYVTPGLIDMHCHLYPVHRNLPNSLSCIDPDAHMFQNGVTTAVDAGTCGIRDFLRFKEEIIDPSAVRVLAMINIANGGMLNMESEQNLADFLPSAVAGLAQSFPQIVVGVKTAHYWVGKPFTTEHPPWGSIDATLEAAELCGLPAMIDFQPTLPERSYQELVLKKLRQGDIHTHMYAQQFPVLDENGQVNPFLFEARQRGVLFDLGHGACSFWFRNAIPAWQQGFMPDTLSTDLYLDNVCGPAFGLNSVMSKYLNIGMPLEEVIFRTTLRPAQVIGRHELGRLEVGGSADIAVLEKQEGSFGFADGGRGRLTGTQRLACLLTIRAGEIVFDREAASLVDWEKADAPYWTAPGILPKRY